MKLSCIGCGPGDPDLLTVKAVDRIRKAQIIFAPTSREGKPSIALSIVRQHISETANSVNLLFPMIKDRESLRPQWRNNASMIGNAVREGKETVYLTVGDPSMYSTWTYINNEIKQTFKDIEVEVIPGITSFFAFAAEAKMSLVEADQTLGIVPSCYDLDKVKNTAKACDAVVFLKDGRYFDSVIAMLPDAGFSDSSIVTIAQDLSGEKEIMKISNLGELRRTKNPAGKYFSLMVAKKN